MKILYSAGNRIGAAYQLKDFVDNCKHEVKVAAYIKSGFLLNKIDWILDAIPPGNKNWYYRDTNAYKFLLQDIDYYEPDLIICDYEPLVANIAKSFGINLWYCSSLHLLNGIDFKLEFYYNMFNNARRNLSTLPECASRCFIYSPFGDVSSGPDTKTGFEWVAPYHRITQCNGNKKIAILYPNHRTEVLTKILKSIPDVDIGVYNNYTNEYMENFSKSDWSFNMGYTTSIADAIYGNIVRTCSAPNISDTETIVNSVICKILGIGDNVGQVEFMEKFAISEIEKSISLLYNKTYSLKNTRNKFLHEIIEEGKNVCI